MKMVALPSGRQRCIHGPAVNIPTKVNSVCSLLPRLPSETQLLPMKLKRKLSYRGHYMYDFIRPDKVLAALHWLQEHNPLYKDIPVNNDWMEQAVSDDQALWKALTAQQEHVHDSKPEIATFSKLVYIRTLCTMFSTVYTCLSHHIFYTIFVTCICRCFYLKIFITRNILERKLFNLWYIYYDQCF